MAIHSHDKHGTFWKRWRKTKTRAAELERRVKTTGDELAHSLEIIEAGQAKSRKAKKELTEANLRVVVSLGKRYLALEASPSFLEATKNK